MKHLKLGTKLLIGGLLTVAIPVIVIGVGAVYQSTQSINELAMGNMGHTAKSLAAGINTAMHMQSVMVRNISYQNSIISAAEKTAKYGEKNSRNELLLAQQSLTKIRNAEAEHLSNITLVGKNGIVYVSSDNGKFKGLDLAGRDYLDAAFKGTSNVGSVVLARATGK